jgi:glycosyltransferase involved in cell wall biosynthesis
VVEVSVVIPAFNHAAFLGEAIESVAASRRVHAEIIVVDDGSMDGSQAVARSFPSVRLLAQANQGAHAAINTGVHAASNRIVAILNDDDVYAPDYLATVGAMLQSGETDLILTRPRVIGTGAVRRRVDGHMAHCDDLILRHGLAWTLLHYNWFVGTSGVAFTTAAFDRLQGFRPFALMHDHDFALRAMMDPAVRVAPGPREGWSYRCHGTNASSTFSEEEAAAEREAVLLPARGIITRHRPRLEVTATGA